MQGDDKVWSQSLEPSSLCVRDCPAGFLPRVGVRGVHLKQNSQPSSRWDLI